MVQKRRRPNRRSRTADTRPTQPSPGIPPPPRSSRGRALANAANITFPFILDPTRAEASARGSMPPKIHAREARLDRVLEFVGFVAKPMPLSLLLDEAPKKIAAIVKADVASLYLLEGDGDELVMRGNVGFPSGARGRVRLSVGEGITGMAVECMRPISVVAAPEHR